MSDQNELYYAHMEADRNEAERAYFDARPMLEWGANPDGASSALVSWCRNHTKAFDKRKRVGKKAAAATPTAFRDLLISIARASHS